MNSSEFCVGFVGLLMLGPEDRGLWEHRAMLYSIRVVWGRGDLISLPAGAVWGQEIVGMRRHGSVESQEAKTYLLAVGHL